MEDFQLTAGQIVLLKALHKNHHDHKKAYRVKAVIRLGTGRAVAEAVWTFRRRSTASRR